MIVSSLLLCSCYLAVVSAKFNAVSLEGLTCRGKKMLCTTFMEKEAGFRPHHLLSRSRSLFSSSEHSRSQNRRRKTKDPLKEGAEYLLRLESDEIEDQALEKMMETEGDHLGFALMDLERKQKMRQRALFHHQRMAEGMRMRWKRSLENHDPDQQCWLPPTCRSILKRLTTTNGQRHAKIESRSTHTINNFATKNSLLDIQPDVRLLLHLGGNRPLQLPRQSYYQRHPSVPMSTTELPLTASLSSQPFRRGLRYKKAPKRTRKGQTASKLDKKKAKRSHKKVKRQRKMSLSTSSEESKEIQRPGRLAGHHQEHAFPHLVPPVWTYPHAHTLPPPPYSRGERIHEHTNGFFDFLFKKIFK